MIQPRIHFPFYLTLHLLSNINSWLGMSCLVGCWVWVFYFGGVWGGNAVLLPPLYLHIWSPFLNSTFYCIWLCWLCFSPDLQMTESCCIPQVGLQISLQGLHLSTNESVCSIPLSELKVKNKLIKVSANFCKEKLIREWTIDNLPLGAVCQAVQHLPCYDLIYHILLDCM